MNMTFQLLFSYIFSLFHLSSVLTLYVSFSLNSALPFTFLLTISLFLTTMSLALSSLLTKLLSSTFNSLFDIRLLVFFLIYGIWFWLLYSWSSKRKSCFRISFHFGCSSQDNSLSLSSDTSHKL